MSADGSRVAYQAVRDGRTVVLVTDARGRTTRTIVRGARVGGATFADPYEPSLSADGSKLVYTLATGRVDDPMGATSQRATASPPIRRSPPTARP
jgi:Tol biopolymer transport system component